jgi:dihydroorotase-like cyclic amidohydrolase
MLGCGWRDVWNRSAIAPAKLMGLPHGLEVGNPAEICFLDFSDTQGQAQITCAN